MYALQKLSTTYFQVDLLKSNVNAERTLSIQVENAYMLQPSLEKLMLKR